MIFKYEWPAFVNWRQLALAGSSLNEKIVGPVATVDRNVVVEWAGLLSGDGSKSIRVGDPDCRRCGRGGQFRVTEDRSPRTPEMG
jgi:hypothetical protein